MAKLDEVVPLGRTLRAETADEDPGADAPPPYPDGWYRLAESAKVPVGRALAIDALGRSFVVFRSRAGTIAVLDGHCPHMGARLGTDGRAPDGCVTCPYHGWRLDAEGRVAEVPYARRTPPNLRTRTYPACEVHGQVFVWHSERRTPPDYALPVLPAIADGSMCLRGQIDGGHARMHVMDFVQNAADVHHFSSLHQDLFVPFTRLRVAGCSTVVDAGWHVDPDEPHVSWLTIHAMARLFGWTARAFAATVKVQYVGPGGIARFHFEHPQFGRIVLDQTLLPIAPMLQRVHFRWHADRTVPRLFVIWVVGQWIAQWREDVEIWSTMDRSRKPMLVREDAAILRMRRWYRRFHAPET